MTNLDPLRGFAEYQRRRNLSPQTVTARRRALKAFARWLDAPLLEATGTDIDGWLDSRDVTAKTRATDLSHLAAFYTWATLVDLVEANPCDKVVRPKIRRYVPRPISEADLALAVAEADTPELRLMLLLAATAGLRVGEIAHVHRSDFIDAQEPPLLVIRAGKTGQRVVPVTRDVVTTMRMIEGDEDRILWRPRGTPATPQWVSQTVSDYLHALGIEATAHMLRHRAATIAYRSTLDLRATQSFLGHSSSAATDIYTQFSPHALNGALGALGSIGRDVEERER